MPPKQLRQPLYHEDFEFMMKNLKEYIDHDKPSSATREYFIANNAEHKAIFVALDEIKECIKESKTGKADKWVEKAIIFLMMGTFGWALNQILQMIPTAKAIYNAL